MDPEHARKDKTQWTSAAHITVCLLGGEIEDATSDDRYEWLEVFPFPSNLASMEFIRLISS